MDHTLVSVVVPAHNAGAYLRPAVLSVLAQGPGVEAVVVDDGSTDGSLASIAGLPARVVRQRRRGEAAARNAGVKAARGAFITFLDADDLLVPGSLATRRERLERAPGELAAGGLPSALIGEGGEIVAAVFERMASRLAFPLRLTLEGYRAGRFFPVSCSLYLYRREAFERAGLYDESLPAAPDADFHFRLLALGGVEVLRAPTFDRRLHAANVSLAGARSSAPSFRPDVLAAIRAVNRRHGIAADDIRPWENDYL